MPFIRASRGLATFVCVAMITPTASLGAAAGRTDDPAASARDERITCTSRNYRYSYCRADTDNRVRLVRQRSSTRCRQWDNWGYDSRGVWVDNGCAAEFEVGRDGGVDGAAAATVGAVAGAAIIAAIIASKKNHDDAVPSWAVGSFRGFDEEESATVLLTVYPSGTVKGTAGNNEFTGTWEKDRLQAGNYRFKVKKSGNGFHAEDEQASRHQITFSRTGSVGY